MSNFHLHLSNITIMSSMSETVTYDNAQLNSINVANWVENYLQRFGRIVIPRKLRFDDANLDAINWIDDDNNNNNDDQNIVVNSSAEGIGF